MKHDYISKTSADLVSFYGNCNRLFYLLAGVGHVFVCCDNGLEAQINALHFTYGIHGRHHQLQEHTTYLAEKNK